MESKGGRDLLWADGNDNGMASVVTACTTCTDVDLCREDVDEFTLAFVAPLCAENNSHCPNHQSCSNIVDRWNENVPGIALMLYLRQSVRVVVERKLADPSWYDSLTDIFACPKKATISKASFRPVHHALCVQGCHADLSIQPAESLTITQKTQATSCAVWATIHTHHGRRVVWSPILYSNAL